MTDQGGWAPLDGPVSPPVPTPAEGWQPPPLGGWQPVTGGGWQPPPPGSDWQAPRLESWAPSGGPTRDSRATLSLVFGILSFVVLPVIGGIVAIIAGISAKSAIARSGGTKTGRSQATAGEVLGIVNVIVAPVFVVLLVMLVLAVRDSTDYTNLQPGACFNAVGGLFPTNVRTVSCSRAHETEIIGGFFATDPGAYPGPAGFRSQAVPRCSQLAQHYLGAESATAANLRITWLVPNEALWDSGTRIVECGLQNSDGTKHTGSVRGS